MKKIVWMRLAHVCGTSAVELRVTNSTSRKYQELVMKAAIAASIAGTDCFGTCKILCVPTELHMSRAVCDPGVAHVLTCFCQC